MNNRYDKSAAIVVLPAVRQGRLRDVKLRAWLSRSSVSSGSSPQGELASILAVLGLEEPGKGLGALRMWGQTGERPGMWVAAADPVYLEPRLDHLCLHALGGDSVSMADMRGVFDALQDELATGSTVGLVRIGKCGYLRAGEPIATASKPAGAVDQQPPNDFLPKGYGAATYRRLVSEVEMVLHGHEVNERREAAGLPPINSLWIWGGGEAPQPEPQPLPPLFAAEPLVCGFWMSNAGRLAEWPGSIEACLETAQGGFVAVPNFASDDPGAAESWLWELRGALARKQLRRLVLIFQDGVVARVRRSDAMRFWRRRNALFG